MTAVYALLFQLLFEAALSGLIGGAGRAFAEKGRLSDYIERCFAGLIFSIFLGYAFRDAGWLLREKSGYNLLGFSVFFATGYFTKEVVLIFAEGGKRLISVMSNRKNNHESDNNNND